MLNRTLIFTCLSIFYSTGYCSQKDMFPYEFKVDNRTVLSIDKYGIERKFNYEFICDKLESNRDIQAEYKNKFGSENLSFALYRGVEHACKINFHRFKGSVTSLAISSAKYKAINSNEPLDFSSYEYFHDRVNFFKEKYESYLDLKRMENITSIQESNKKLLLAIKKEESIKVAQCDNEYENVLANDQKGINLFEDAIRNKRNIKHVDNIIKYGFLVEQSNDECKKQKRYIDLKKSVDNSLVSLNDYRNGLVKTSSSKSKNSNKERSENKKKYNQGRSSWFIENDSVICISPKALEYQTALISQEVNKLAKGCYVTKQKFDVIVLKHGLLESHVKLIENDLDVWTYGEFINKRY
ncbi:hypothetical protein RAX51_001852 [Vibrio fluvialis]|nr:hypothetical protein [Vibrio fluvialis]